MSSFDDFAYPDSFDLKKPDGAVLSVRGSVNNRDMYLLTTDEITPTDVVERKLSTGKKEVYQILDVQFIEAECGSPAQQRLSVKRVFD